MKQKIIKIRYYCPKCGRVESIFPEDNPPKYCLGCYNKYKTIHHKHKMYRINKENTIITKKEVKS